MKMDMAAMLGPKPVEPGAEDPYSADLESAMEDFVASVKSGDVAGAAAAFKAAHEICAGGSEVV